MAAKDANGGKAADLTSEQLYRNVYGSVGTPLNPGSRLLTQPLLSKNDREVLQDLMGARVQSVKTEPMDGSAPYTQAKYKVTPRPNFEMYNATERTNDGQSPTSGRSTYVTQYKGINNPFVKKFLDTDGTITFDNVDFSKVVKIPTFSGYKPAVYVTKVIPGNKEAGRPEETVRGYVVIPQDEATKTQLRTHPAANRAKSEARAAAGASGQSAGATEIPFVPLDSEDDDNN